MYGIVGQNPIDYAYFIEWIDVGMTSNNVKVVTINGEELVVTSSRDVANDFGKEHKDVLVKIRGKVRKDGRVEVGLIQGMEDVGEIPSNYFIENECEDSYGRTQVEYLLTRDGFSLLVMGFTGKEALQWKLQYIQDFNEMERQLHEIKEKVEEQGSISKEEFYEIHFANAKRIRKAFEMTDDLNELFGNFLEYVSKMSVTEKVKRYEHLQKVLDDILNVRVRDLSIELNEVICLRSEITNMKLKLEELINETLNRSYAQQLRYAKEKTTA